MRKVKTVSVRNIIENVLKKGDITSGTLLGQERLRQGIDIHKFIQKSRPENYHSEVTVKKTIPTKHYDLTIQGRIDGIYHFPQKIVVEEIKSVSSELTEVDGNELHWAQCKFYAYIYCESRDYDEISLKLTYVNTASMEVKEIEEDISLAELKVFFDQIVEKYIDWIEQIAENKEIFIDSAKRLEFPFSSYRKGQREMAIAVFRSLRDGERLFVEAPTGIGKTMATLFPAIKALSEGIGDKIFYLTARNTGKNVCEENLRLLNKNGLRSKSVTITAKEKICFQSETICTGEDCEYARGYFDRIDEAQKDIMKLDHLDRNTIEHYALKHFVCPFEFSLEISNWADIIICDYNYVFDPRVKLKRFFIDNYRKERYLFLIDESHNLVDRARNMFSCQIERDHFLQMGKLLKKSEKGIYSNISKIKKILNEMWNGAESGSAEAVIKEFPKELKEKLAMFIKITEKWLNTNTQPEFRVQLLDLYFNIVAFNRILQFLDENYRIIIKKNRSNKLLKLFCLNPSKLINTALKTSYSTVFFSATLSPSGYFRELYGSLDSSTLKLSSPFLADNLLVLSVPNISTRYKQRENTCVDLAKIMLKFIHSRKANYLLFFPSYAYLNLLLPYFRFENSDMRLLFQKPLMTDDERQIFLSNFREDDEITTVGLTVSGGIFGEGIDLVGNRLDGVVIIGVGLPSLSFERNLIKEYFDVNGKGYNYAYKYPGMIRVLQAAGRVIRSETDRGVILLIDDRFENHTYKKLLPSYWNIRKVFDEKTLEKFMRYFFK